MNEKRILFVMGCLLLVGINGYFFVAVRYPHRGLWYVCLVVGFGIWYWLRLQNFKKKNKANDQQLDKKTGSV